MDIEIKNQEQVLSICQTVQNEKLKQLSNCISSLESNISSVKEKWSSTGIDKETYVIELEKQVENLRTIYQLLGGFSKTITNYTESVKRTAANTIGVGAGMGAVSGALAGASSLKATNSNGTSSVGKNTSSNGNVGGANNMTYNQHMMFWKENKNDIIKSKDDFFVIKLSLDYYKKNFQSINEEILRKEEAGEITQEIK